MYKHVDNTIYIMVQYWWVSAQVVYSLVQEINTQGVKGKWANHYLLLHQAAIYPALLILLDFSCVMNCTVSCYRQ